MTQQKKLDPTERQVHFINAIYDIAKSVIVPKKKLSQYDIAVYGRIVGGLIYELKSIYSGYTSVNALIQKYNTGRDWTHEHKWPRQYVGEDLIKDLYRRGQVTRIDINLILDDFDDFCVVNHTTKEENEALRPFQKLDGWVSPEYAYEQAGIELLPWPAGTRIVKLPEIYPTLIPFLKSTVTTTGNSEHLDPI